jgi:uncharacterized DUF497 family protein
VVPGRIVGHTPAAPPIDGTYNYMYTRFVAFEWDPNKALVNARKHGVRFSEALSVFGDDIRIISARTAERPEREQYEAQR